MTPAMHPATPRGLSWRRVLLPRRRWLLRLVARQMPAGRGLSPTCGCGRAPEPGCRCCSGAVLKPHTNAPPHHHHHKPHNHSQWDRPGEGKRPPSQYASETRHRPAAMETTPRCHGNGPMLGWPLGTHWTPRWKVQVTVQLLAAET